MQLSMTGFAHVTGFFGNKQLNIDIKSLNSKQLDITVRVPNLYKELEFEIRDKLAKQLVRGKIDFILFYENLEPIANITIQQENFIAYYHKLLELKNTLHLNDYQPDWFATILRLPEVINPLTETISEEEKNVVFSLVNEATSKLIEFRKSEGNTLMTDILQRVNQIQNLLEPIDSLDVLRIENIRNKLKSLLNEHFNEAQIDKNRFEQELIYYLDKLDINEEKQRLKNHCQYFISTAENEPMAGRKLTFIAQEMGREINTLGSKAQDAQIQKLVVEMKDELEKIKEQLANIL